MASPNQKNSKYNLYMWACLCQSGKTTAKLAICASKNTKKTGNRLYSFLRHKVTATAATIRGCRHHKYSETVWLCQVMLDKGISGNFGGWPYSTSSGTRPFWVNLLR